MKFPIQLSIAVVAVSCSVGGLFLLGQQGAPPKKQTSPQAGESTIRAPISQPALELTPAQELLLAESLLPPQAWGKLSLLGSLTGAAPFADETFTQLSEDQARACRQEPAPRVIALAVLKDENENGLGLDTLLSRVVAISPAATPRFVECAMAKIKAAGGASSHSSQGQQVRGPAGTLFQHKNGSLAFARNETDLPPLIERLANLPQLLTLHAHSKPQHQNLTVTLMIEPQANWLKLAGSLVHTSPLQALQSIRFRLLGRERLQASFLTSPAGAAPLHQFLKRGLKDIEQVLHENQGNDGRPSGPLTPWLAQLPPGARGKLTTLLQLTQISTPQIKNDSSEAVIELSFDLKKAGLSNLLQNALGSAPQP